MEEGKKIMTYNNIKWDAKTDIGLKRKTNEDDFYVADLTDTYINHRHMGIMFAVADGLGGHFAGDIASRMACEGLKNYYMEKLSEGKKSFSIDYLRTRLVNTIHDIDKTITGRAKTEDACSDMGTTLSVLVLKDKTAIIAHVGDSRIYNLRNNQLVQLTQDHTFVQEMIDEGELDPANVSGHPLRNMLTRTVGTEEPLEEVFTMTEKISPGDSFLLCSDGLHGMVSDEAIYKIMSADPDPETTSTRLIETAIRNGGKDNITVIVIRT
jgi:serine/threonine protein phosphatase PrpC